MHIVLAPDSFKGSLSSLHAANIMKNAIQSLNNQDKITIKPMADGGEGTVKAMLAAVRGEKIAVKCTGPLGDSVTTYYAIIDDDTAIIEVANIAGLPQVPFLKRNPDNTTTFGLGEVIHDALDRGCRSIIIGLGGSATNDAGLGMLTALGMKAYDQYGTKIGSFGRDLIHVAEIDLSELDPRLRDIDIQVACDVKNPLIGKKGASAIFGRQKGITVEQITIYDKAMEHFAQLMIHETRASSTDIERLNPENIIKNGKRTPDFRENVVSGDSFAIDSNESSVLESQLPGTGAAGGLGFALTMLGAKLISGAKLVAETSQVEDAIKQADLVITGEGKSDEQTLFGKAPAYIANIADKHCVPVILMTGALDVDDAQLFEKFTACFSIINKPLTTDDAMEQAENLLYQKTKHIINLLHKTSYRKKGNDVE